MSSVTPNLKEIQKFYMMAREIHEQLAYMQGLADRNGITLKGFQSIGEMNQTLQQWHNMARILEEYIKNPTETAKHMEVIPNAK